MNSSQVFSMSVRHKFLMFQKWSLPPTSWNDITSDAANSVYIYMDNATGPNGHTMKSYITHHTSHRQSLKHSKFIPFTHGCEYYTTYRRNECQTTVLLCSCLQSVLKNMHSLDKYYHTLYHLLLCYLRALCNQHNRVHWCRN
jgi:hypothetical protein